MDEDPRSGARAWAAALITAAPWSDVAARASLWLVAPPHLEWEAEPASVEPQAWLLVEASEARALPVAERNALLGVGALTPSVEGGSLLVVSAEGLGRLVEAVTRPGLEARWLVRHAEAVHDPLRRLDELKGRATAMPPDALERTIRPLFLQLVSALNALDGGGVAAAGEAESSLARIACTMDEGCHPPLQWLGEAARRTVLGPRLSNWLDDLPRAVAGDEAAQRRVLAARAGVRRSVVELLRQHLGTFDWLTAPEAYLLRAPR
ncbi:MAG: hypothetical protein R3C39_12305 [Dehalococcoidia bacterium]